MRRSTSGTSSSTTHGGRRARRRTALQVPRVAASRKRAATVEPRAVLLVRPDDQGVTTLRASLRRPNPAGLRLRPLRDRPIVIIGVIARSALGEIRTSEEGGTIAFTGAPYHPIPARRTLHAILKDLDLRIRLFAVWIVRAAEEPLSSRPIRANYEPAGPAGRAQSGTPFIMSVFWGVDRDVGRAETALQLLDERRGVLSTSRAT